MEKCIDPSLIEAPRNLKAESQIRTTIENEAQNGGKMEKNMPENIIGRSDI